MLAQKITAEITNALGSEILVTGEQIKSRYSHIWDMETPLTAMIVALPRSTQEVAALCKICHKFNQPIVIHGGLTGLVGATKSKSTDVVISLEKLNKIEEIDTACKSITVQSGVILETIHEEVAKKDLFFPLNFGAKGSAQIGGCIATNAGGLRVLKYGMTRNLVLGLEVVMPDGTIISSLKKIIKDNSGYDLTQLFIGSEGTLGIITKAVLKLETLPLTRSSAFIGFNSYDNIVQFLKFAQRGFLGRLSAFEILWGDTYEALTSAHSLYRPPISHGNKYYVLIEILGNSQTADIHLMENVLEEGLENGFFDDAVIANSSSDLNWFWNIREDLTPINSLTPYQQNFDISISINFVDHYVNEVTNSLSKLKGISVYAFGHLGDGNIHFLVGKHSEDKKLKDQINEIVYSPLKQYNGSVSAEHGIGLDKKEWLAVTKTSEEIDLMKKIKMALDPKCILNPGRIIDEY